MPEENIKLLIADDHALVRHGITSLLCNINGLYIVGEAENGKELVTKYFKLRPDIIVSDIYMPEMTGIDALQMIRKRDKAVKVLFLSMYEGEDYIYQVWKAGGKGLINKNIVAGELLFAIETIYKGGNYFGPKYDARKLAELEEKYSNIREQDASSVKFNEKETEIIRLVCQGLTSQEIGEKMNLSPRTIEGYRSGIMERLGIASPFKLIKYAMINGIIEKV